MAIAYTTTTSEVMTNDTCLEHCTYVEPKLECYGCIPQWVPNGTKEVFLVKLRPNKFLFTRFCGINWPYITSLAITTEDNVSYRLRNRVFHCLGFLHTLRLNSPYLLSFDYGTFIGLTNLTTFDISGCKRLSILYVFKILSLPNNFPILNKILLSSIDPSQQQIIDQNFIQALSTRPINYIDLSSIYLGLSFTSADNLCKTLHTLVIRDASLFLWGGFQSLKKCSSLRVYDNTGTGKLTGLMCVNDTWFELGYRFFRAVKVLISNRKIQSPLPKTEVANCTLDYLRDSSVEELHFAENNLPSFEFKLKNAIINFLNLSHNKIEHINSDAVRYLPALARLDISNNDLAKAKAFDTTFSHLFKFNIELIEIDLSVNNLEFLPNETFVHNNHLELLNLSSNKFDQIHFHFWNLPNLTTIDMRTNTIVSLDLHSRQSIDHWHSLKLENNKSVNLLLYGNPFSCSCSSLDFVKWLVASPIFSSTVHQYHCYIEGQRMPLTLNAAQGDCDRIQRQRLRTKLVSTLPPICALVLLVLALVLYRRYKRRQWIRLQDDRIRLLRENEAMFPVFLSHSSDDYEFVRDNILKPLQVFASEAVCLNFFNVFPKNLI